MAKRKAEMQHYAVPDEKTLQEAGELAVLDEQNNSVPFKTLYADSEPAKHVIVFIRHFYCGHCEDYVRTLTTALPPARLAKVNASLVVIGCGQPFVVGDYRQRTSCPFPIYCDPSRSLYKKLGMTENMGLGDKKPEYIKSGIVGGTLSSAWNIISKAPKALSGGGNYAQNGGEWVFENGKCTWARRMRNTRDHAEVKELEEVLGLVG